MKFSHIIEQFPRDWETTVCQNVSLTVFHIKSICHPACKTLSTKLWCFVVLQSWSEGWKARITMGQICFTVFLHFMTISPLLETNDGLRFSSECFPRMVIYILCIEIFQKLISTHSFIPIAGRLFYNLRKLQGPRIWECNIYIWQLSRHPTRLHAETLTHTLNILWGCAF